MYLTIHLYLKTEGKFDRFCRFNEFSMFYLVSRYTERQTRTDRHRHADTQTHRHPRLDSNSFSDTKIK